MISKGGGPEFRSKNKLKSQRTLSKRGDSASNRSQASYGHIVKHVNVNLMSPKSKLMKNRLPSISHNMMNASNFDKVSHVNTSNIIDDFDSNTDQQELTLDDAQQEVT